MTKKKMVVIEESVHKELKHIATDQDTSIQQIVNDILKKELKIGGNKQ